MKRIFSVLAAIATFFTVVLYSFFTLLPLWGKNVAKSYESILTAVMLISFSLLLLLLPPLIFLRAWIPVKEELIKGKKFKELDILLVGDLLKYGILGILATIGVVYLFVEVLPIFFSTL